MTRAEALSRYFENLRNGRSGDQIHALKLYGDDCERIGREGRIAEGEAAMGELMHDIMEASHERP